VSYNDYSDQRHIMTIVTRHNDYSDMYYIMTTVICIIIDLSDVIMTTVTCVI